MSAKDSVCVFVCVSVCVYVHVSPCQHLGTMQAMKATADGPEHLRASSVCVCVCLHLDKLLFRQDKITLSEFSTAPVALTCFSFWKHALFTFTNIHLRMHQLFVRII